MALTEKDLAIAIQKLRERNALAAKPTERMSLDEFNRMYAGPSANADAVEESSKKVAKESETVAKSLSDKTEDGVYKETVKQTEYAEKTNDYQKEQLEALLRLGKSFESFKSPMEKLASKLQSFSRENIKETLLQKMNIKLPIIGGIFDKAIAKERFIKQEKLLGSTKTRSEISRDFKSYNEQSKIIQKNSETISKIKAALPDASEEQLMRVPEYARAKQESETAAKESGKFTVKSSVMNPTNEEVGSTTKNQPNKRTPQRVGNNIIPKTTNITPKLGFSDKLERVGGGMVGAAKGVAAMGGALIALSFGIKAISAVNFESIAKATLALVGLVGVSKLMGDNTGSMLKGALGIAALGAALMVATEGFKSFAELDWEALGKAGAAVTGLAVAAAGIGTFIGPILAGAAAIAAIGGSVWVLAKGVESLAGAIDKIKSAKIATKPANGEIPTGQPTTNAIAPTKAETTGTKEGWKQTYDKHIAEGRAPFAAKMFADREHGLQGTGASAETLPSKTIPKVTPAPVATANVVYGASAENASVASASNIGTTTNVVAPTTVNNTTNTTGGYKPDVRNQDSSFKRMLDNRYVPV